VTMSVTGLPAGASGTFTSNPVVISGTGAQTTTLNVTTTNESSGTYTFNITGTSGAMSGSTVASLTIKGAVATLSPSTLAFGNQVINTTSTVHNATLTASGGTVSGISVSITGTNAGDFAQTNNCPSSLPAGQSCTISVTYTPSVLGAESASLTVNDSAGTQSASLTGTGIAPDALTPTSSSFGNVAVGSPSTAKVFTLMNNETSALTFSVSFNGANPGDFSESDTCAGTVKAKSSCALHVTFTPSIIGAESANLAVATSAGAPYNSLSASLTGTGTGDDTLTPASVAFGSVPEGTPSATKNFTFKNNETVALTISSIGFTGTNAGDFSQTDTCGGSVAAKSTCTITVTFTPSIIGAESATLNVNSVGNPSTVSATLTGTGIAQVTTTPASINFGSVKVGTSSKSYNVTLKNNLTSALAFTTSFTGADPGDFSATNSCSGSVPAKGSCTIGVVFTPTATGSRTATLDVNDSANNSPQTVSLSGTGH